MADLKLEDVKKDVDRNTLAINRITKFLFGNGEEGMDEVWRQTAKDVSELKEIQKKKQSRRDAIELGLILTLISNGVGWIWFLATRVP